MKYVSVIFSYQIQATELLLIVRSSIVRGRISRDSKIKRGKSASKSINEGQLADFLFFK